MDMDIIAHVNALIEKGKTFCLVTVVASSLEPVSAGQKSIVVADGTITGSFGYDRADQYVRSQALMYMSQKKSGIAWFENDLELFFNVIASETRLLICGAGHIAVPLAQFSVQAGFQVTVLDDRPDFAAATRFPDCAVIAQEFSPALKNMKLGPNVFVVVITRGHEHDTECLQEILPKQTEYIGLIGSRRRVRFVLEMLRSEGIPKKRLNDVFTPIGIPIGAESPVEIALSIVAELVCVRRKGWQQARALRAAIGIDQ
jgi:xanthine dehydrogenase accessory factor